jgi:hypothetical protein
MPILIKSLDCLRDARHYIKLYEYYGVALLIEGPFCSYRSLRVGQ